MAANIAEYGIEIGFGKALQNLRKIKSINQKMQKMNEDSLSRQIALQKRLNALSASGVVGKKVIGVPTENIVRQPKVPTQKPAPTQDAHVKAREKAMNAAYKEQVSLQKLINKLESSERLLVSDVLTEQEKIVAAKIREHIASAKTASELRGIVATEKIHLNNQIKSTKQLEKQNFLLQRLNSSSKQFAGNMVSAFALAAGVTGATKVGQDFEATAVAIETASGSAEAGAKNLEFLRQQARRLGIDYTSSAKGLSQLLAAGEGVLAQEDLRNIFLGVTEASTVMGLSMDDTSGAIRAIHQMMSKGKISAKLMVA